ncbi:hypothetical protein ASPZODRAFT_129029 [Penicilliopsis zonata CBS 506.65]|uniref:Beta-galactosidase n=1 Tax=Penicilliopsis zonata CBS 506.65 TaxID=1073090 RepID=A0A1L9ST79_9EURO|nr:hypothetical protein ASPZODRAFT_129029 [Penicilliopsis zonata CBS 506.65]OJJ50408.1 hypothetical protein ASPZODRAFT_129029 [Penicilliopsis zonata CBS 506.65]
MKLFGALALAGLLSYGAEAASSRRFGYTNTTFYLEGKPFQIVGGQMDPQRVPYQYWRERLNKARSMGLNTIFSYVYWNLLEPEPGHWATDEPNNNIAEYFRIAQEEGLNIVLRPGPYICGEREWGGFPWWLSEIPGLEVRTNNTLFLYYAGLYLDRLAEEIRPLQATKGGPILMIQVENEYGSYGSNHNYTARLRDMLRENFDSVLYTNDGGVNWTLAGGSVPGVLAETDGTPESGFEARDEYITNPTELGPLLDGEYYTLAPDQWGSNATHNDPDDDPADLNGFVNDLEFVLNGSNSISFYMFHGGTNYGFGNGGIWRDANYLAAFTTSYDYGAPLDESGRTTELYYILRETIEKYFPNGSIPAVVPDVPRSSIDEFALEPVASVFDTLLPEPVQSEHPVSMESLGQAYGYVLYETTAQQAYTGILQVGDRPRDRVIVYVNGVKQGVVDAIYETVGEVKVTLQAGDKLQLLVENLGRVDYWSLGSGTFNALLEPHKGIVGNVTVGGEIVTKWNVYSLPFDQVPIVNSGSSSSNNNNTTTIETLPQTPVVYSGRFQLADRDRSSKTDLELDTFLAIPRGTKGVVWVNGFNLGRYWIIGPQQSLYLPGVHLRREGWNEVVVLELEPTEQVMEAEGQSERVWANHADPDAPGLPSLGS